MNERWIEATYVYPGHHDTRTVWINMRQALRIIPHSAGVKIEGNGWKDGPFQEAVEYFLTNSSR